MPLHQVNPLVVTLDDFATPAECAGVIEAARGRLQRARVTSDGVAESEHEGRTNWLAALKPGDCPALAPLALRLSVRLRLPLTHAERSVALHYRPGQEFRPHHDGFDLDTAAPELDQRGGQRLFTSILYLNQPEGGGATDFPKLGISVAPAPGRLLIFANTLAGSRDASTLSLHAGTPVTAGEKWALTIWWCERPIVDRSVSFMG